MTQNFHSLAFASQEKHHLKISLLYFSKYKIYGTFLYILVFTINFSIMKYWSPLLMDSC